MFDTIFVVVLLLVLGLGAWMGFKSLSRCSQCGKVIWGEVSRITKEDGFHITRRCCGIDHTEIVKWEDMH